MKTNSKHPDWAITQRKPGTELKNIYGSPLHGFLFDVHLAFRGLPPTATVRPSLRDFITM